MANESPREKTLNAMRGFYFNTALFIKINCEKILKDYFAKESLKKVEWDALFEEMKTKYFEKIEKDLPK